MQLADVTLWQWCLAALAAVMVGCAKTGIPGIGILVVPLMAAAFGGKPSVGTLLPMLIVADCFAVFWYRRHAQWDKLVRLIPWVVPGLVLGTVVLALLGEVRILGFDGNELFKPGIGLLVLVMLVLLLLRRRYGETLTPRHTATIALTGSGTGLATTLANAAGPIMTLYLAGMRMPKEQFMGTNAWFFLLLNLCKIPLYLLVGLADPSQPMITADSLLLDACLVPLIIAGAFLGRWLLPKLSQRWFDGLVLVLAAVAALRLCLDPWL